LQDRIKKLEKKEEELYKVIAKIEHAEVILRGISYYSSPHWLQLFPVVSVWKI